MGKEKFSISDQIGKKITATEDLTGGYNRLTFNDGSQIIANIVPVIIKVVPNKELETAKEENKKSKGKKAPEPEPEDDEDEEDSITVEEAREALIESGLTKAKVKKMSDEEVVAAYEELEEEDEDEEEERDERKSRADGEPPARTPSRGGRAQRMALDQFDARYSPAVVVWSSVGMTGVPLTSGRAPQGRATVGFPSTRYSPSRTLLLGSPSQNRSGKIW